MKEKEITKKMKEIVKSRCEMEIQRDEYINKSMVCEEYSSYYIKMAAEIQRIIENIDKIIEKSISKNNYIKYQARMQCLLMMTKK